jgi:hypothetical protein
VIYARILSAIMPNHPCLFPTGSNCEFYSNHPLSLSISRHSSHYPNAYATLNDSDTNKNTSTTLIYSDDWIIKLTLTWCTDLFNRGPGNYTFSKPNYKLCENRKFLLTACLKLSPSSHHVTNKNCLHVIWLGPWSQETFIRTTEKCKYIVIEISKSMLSFVHFLLT